MAPILVISTKVAEFTIAATETYMSRFLMAG